jgi:hypothetical protein
MLQNSIRDLTEQHQFKTYGVQKDISGQMAFLLKKI